jgi:hypothetical protein
MSIDGADHVTTRSIDKSRDFRVASKRVDHPTAA